MQFSGHFRYYYTNITNLTVSVHKGLVNIGGIVGRYAEKILIEKVIQKIDGVKALADEITVKYNSLTIHSDSEIATAVINAIDSNVFLLENKPKVKVVNGLVTLIGDVNWWYQRQKAENCIRNIPGVLYINNQIEIRHSANMASG